MYITKAQALEAGMTHEGYLFGVPAWFEGDGEGSDLFYATPKCPWLRHWCGFVDWLLDAAAHFIPANYELVSPIRVTGPIV